MAIDQQKRSSPKDRIAQWQNRASSSDVGADDLVSPKATKKGVVPRASSSVASSAADSSDLTNATPDGGMPPKLLKKKIAKTQTLMSEAETKEKKGRESKLYRRLTEKLEKYEFEMAHLEAEENNAPPKPTTNGVFPITQLKSPDLTNTKKTGGAFPVVPTSPLGSPVGAFSKKNFSLPNVTTANRRGSDFSVLSVGTTDTTTATPNTLQKKIKKVKKLMAEMIDQHGEKAKEKKLYKGYQKKLAEYTATVGDFESRMKKQAMDGKDVLPIVKTPKLSPKVRSKKENPAQTYEEQPIKFGDEAGQSSPSPKKKKSSRSGPRKKTTRVSAARIQELDREFKPAVHEKDEAAQVLIRKEITSNFIFEKLNDRSVEILVKAFEATSTYAPGELIVEQGEETADIYFFIVASGRVDFEVDGKKVGSAEAGKSFGEQGLLYSCPRKASVRASSRTDVFRVDQITFRYVLQNQTKFYQVWKQATRKVMAMNRLLGAAALKKMMEEESDDESDDDKYDISKDFDADDERGSFNVGGALQDEQEEFVGEMMSQMSSRRMSMQNSFQASRLSLASFNRESMLGEGQFGEVWMVTPAIEDLKDQNFALKIQAKEDVMREGPGLKMSVAEAIERECDILSQFCHPFICEFVHKFEDDDNIYLVMGVIRGMELWNVLHREDDDGEWESGISEENAKFYGALIADTMRYMHRQKICYRDLKPENIMIDETGYPVYVDFGFAKHIPDGRTFTFCGTPNYTCPEIISNEGHGFAADWWAFGIVVYEMVSGENPFYYDGIGEMQLLEEIGHNEPEPLSEERSAEVKDLTSKLLIKDPHKRLGTSSPDDILNHPWFASIDLSKGRDKMLDAPFIPPVSDD